MEHDPFIEGGSRQPPAFRNSGGGVSGGDHGDLIIGVVLKTPGLQTLLLHKGIRHKLDHAQTGVVVALTGILEHGLDMDLPKAGFPEDFHHVQVGKQSAGQGQIHPVFRHSKCIGKALAIAAGFHSSQGVEEAGTAFR